MSKDGLKPIGEIVKDALSGMGGPVPAIRETPPPARRGFTLADQVNQLVSASEADADLGFMARTMALCSLPRSNPGNRKEYKRVNGPFTLYVSVEPFHLFRYLDEQAYRYNNRKDATDFDRLRRLPLRSSGSG